MNTLQPTVVILAGCNGAGKTTTSKALLAETLQLMTFVNADFIAQGLAGFNLPLVDAWWVYNIIPTLANCCSWPKLGRIVIELSIAGWTDGPVV